MIDGLATGPNDQFNSEAPRIMRVATALMLAFFSTAASAPTAAMSPEYPRVDAVLAVGESNPVGMRSAAGYGDVAAVNLTISFDEPQATWSVTQLSGDGVVETELRDKSRQGLDDIAAARLNARTPPTQAEQGQRHSTLADAIRRNEDWFFASDQRRFIAQIASQSDTNGSGTGSENDCRRLLDVVSAVDREFRTVEFGGVLTFSEDLRALVSSLSGLRCNPHAIHERLVAFSTYSEGPYWNGPVSVYVFCRRSLTFSFGFDPEPGSIRLPALYFDKSISHGCLND